MLPKMRSSLEQWRFWEREEDDGKIAGEEAELVLFILQQQQVAGVVAHAHPGHASDLHLKAGEEIRFVVRWVAAVSVSVCSTGQSLTLHALSGNVIDGEEFHASIV
jgi:hypothetical protein